MKLFLKFFIFLSCSSYFFNINAEENTSPIQSNPIQNKIKMIRSKNQVSSEENGIFPGGIAKNIGLQVIFIFPNLLQEMISLFIMLKVRILQHPQLRRELKYLSLNIVFVLDIILMHNILLPQNLILIIQNIIQISIKLLK